MIWLFGRPAAGKTTLAKLLLKTQEKQQKSCLLDGDELRKNISKDLGFSLEDRFEHIKRSLRLFQEKQKQGYFVIAALITPMEIYRQYIKEQQPDIQLIYVNCSLNTCQKRDPKGLYKKAKEKSITNFTGLSQAFEEAQHPDLIVNTDQENATQSSQKIQQHLHKVLINN